MAEKYIRTQYADGSVVLSNVRSKKTNQTYSLVKTTTYADGTTMSDAKVDGDIYRKLGAEYFVRALDTSKSRTLTVATVSALKSLSIQNTLLIRLGYYNKVETKGYYSANDGGGIDYNIQINNTGIDDGFLIIRPTIDLVIQFNPNLKGEINIRVAGAKGDDTKDDTVSIQAALTAAYTLQLGVYIPVGIYKTTSSVGIRNTDTAVSFKTYTVPTIRGEQTNYASTINTVNFHRQKGSIIKFYGTGNCLEITSSASSNGFPGGTFKDFTLINNTKSKPTDGTKGLYISRCWDYKMYNVAFFGFDVGFHNNFGFSWDAFGVTATDNNIGILLTNNSNAISINGYQGHQNNIGIKIMGGQNILINRATLEGQNFGSVITSDGTTPYPSDIRFNNIYAEVNAVGMFRIGQDENGVTSPNEISSVSIDSITSNTNVDTVQLDFVNGINISGFVNGYSKFVSVTDKTRKLSFNGTVTSYTNSHLSGRYAVKNKLAISSSVNLLPNLFNNYPLLDQIKGAFAAGTDTSFVYDTTTFTGERVIRLPLAPGETGLHGRIIVKIDKRMVGKILNASFCGSKSTDSISGSLTFYSPALGGISSSGMALTSVPLSTGKSTFNCPDLEYMLMSINITTNTATDISYVYIKSVALTLGENSSISPSVSDLFAGFSGSVSAATGAGKVVTLEGYDSFMYDVLLTPYANITAYVTKANGSFTIIASGAGTISYLVIPKCGLMM